MAQRIGSKVYAEKMKNIAVTHGAEFVKYRDDAFAFARNQASQEIMTVRQQFTKKLVNLANEADGLLTKLGRGIGVLGQVSAKGVPFVVAGVVYFRTGDANAEGRQLVPGVGYVEMGGAALVSYAEYCRDEVERTAFENKYSEKLYMGPAWRRSSDYQRALAQRQQ